jgi:hypothetical protein
MVQISVELTGDVDHIRRYREYMQRAVKGGDTAAFDGFGLKVLAMYAAFAQRRFDIFSRGGGDWQPLAPSTIYRRARATVERAKKEADANLARGYSERIEKENGVKYKVRRVFGSKQHARAMARAENRVKQFFRKAYGYAPSHGQGALQRATQIPAHGSVSILRDTGTLFRALSVGNPANVMRKRGATFEYGIGGPEMHPDSKLSVGRIAAYHQAGGTIPNRPPQRKILVTPPTSDQVWSEFDKAAKIFLQRVWNESRG